MTRLVDGNRPRPTDLGIVVLWALFVSLFSMFFCNPITAYAQSYKTLDFPYLQVYEDSSRTEEAFGQYYKCSKSWSLYISTGENGPWEKTGLSKYAIVSKDKVYGVRGKTLYVYDIKKRIRKKVLGFSKQCALAAMYKNNAYVTYWEDYITNGGRKESRYRTAVCNLNTRKILTKKTDFIIDAFWENYVAVVEKADLAQSIYLYKLTGNGFKKVRTITKYGDVIGMYNGRVYYMKYKDSAMKSPKLCTQKVTSSSEKQIASFKGTSAYATEAGEDGCIIDQDVNGKTSILSVNYSTGEISKLPGF